MMMNILRTYLHDSLLLRCMHIEAHIHSASLMNVKLAANGLAQLPLQAPGRGRGPVKRDDSADPVLLEPGLVRDRHFEVIK